MVHPFTNFLVHSIQIIYEDIAQGPGNLSEAVKDLSWLCCFLDAKGQNTLADDMKTLERLVDNPADVSKDIFRPLLKKVMMELHKEGYFLLAKYNPLQEKDFEDLEQGEAEEF